MNTKVILGVVVLILLTAAGAFWFYGDAFRSSKEGEDFVHIQLKDKEKEAAPVGKSPIEELNQLAAKISNDMRVEMRMNLNMLGQLHAYQDMLEQVQEYANQVEKDIDFIKEMNQGRFQDDVTLQASLFSGKKPDLVARHLEEFRSHRVGAILAKMKEKEASAVLDTWAEQKTPKVSAFYRQVVTAYLANKRRDENPEVFKLGGGNNPKTAEAAGGPTQG